MTPEQITALTDDEIRLKVAELLGWADIDDFTETGMDPRSQRVWDIPDFPRDLNACHEMEKTLSLGEKCYYVDLLQGKMGSLEWGFATARQRCESFIAVKERDI